MRHVPLLVIPFLIYNAFAFLIFVDSDPGFQEATAISFPVISGATFTLSLGAAIVLLGLLFLAIEVVKASRIGRGSITDHVLATVLLVAFIVEFLIFPQAATSTFVILMAIALVDLICGFAVSIRTASRDVSFDG
jgi:hypothetical protein